ncbi:MAG: glycosyltransferase family 2 protein [Alsobacter sp.]
MFLGQVAVIIAAKNAAPWIRDAVASALREPEVGEVWVVDDGSTDGTSAAAANADDHSGRLQTLSLPRNVGPSAARNLVLDRTRLPYVAILDADDRFARGRLAALLDSGGDWDFVCDNITLVPEGEGESPWQASAGPHRWSRILTPAEFVEGNVSKGVFNRQELGFLKPLIRRAFLEEHALRYDEDLFLGEDYVLYVRALMLGARFKIIDSTGYLALMRSGSLSSRHEGRDLEKIAAFDDIARGETSDARLREALAAHRGHVVHKAKHREFLDVSKREGKMRAVAWLSREPDSVPYIVKTTIQLKLYHALQRMKPRSEPDGQRFLLQDSFFSENVGPAASK